jgi:hypothetical protein
MLSYNTQLRIDATVADFIKANRMFTAAEIVAIVRAAHPGTRDRYAVMRDHIHALFFNVDMGEDYDRTSVAFPTRKGLESAFVYHPADQNPAKYVSHEMRKEAAVPAPMPAPNLSVADDLDWLPEEEDVVVRPPAPSLRRETVRPSAPTPQAQPQYMLDDKASVLLGREVTNRITSSHFSTLYATPSLGKVVLSNSSDGFNPYATSLLLDDNWTARIPHAVFAEAALNVNKLVVTVSEDDGAVHLTEKA